MDTFTKKGGHLIFHQSLLSRDFKTASVASKAEKCLKLSDTLICDQKHRKNYMYMCELWIRRIGVFEIKTGWVVLVELGREFHSFIVVGKNELANNEEQAKGCGELK